jgi:hypothetical protein
MGKGCCKYSCHGCFVDCVSSVRDEAENAYSKHEILSGFAVIFGGLFFNFFDKFICGPRTEFMGISCKGGVYLSIYFFVPDCANRVSGIRFMYV